MNRTYVFLLLLSVLFLGCSKSDDTVGTRQVTPDSQTTTDTSQPEEEEEELPNAAPNEFGLVSVADNADGVDVLPTLVWEEAVDPDGDPVTYTLFLDKTDSPSTIIAENIEATEFTLIERLNLVSDYHWRVVATDVAGNSVESGIRSFRTRNLRSSSPVSTLPISGWSRGIVFQDRIWVFTSQLNDDQLFEINLHSSGNGLDWEKHELPSELSLSGKRLGGFTVTEFQDVLWIHGGGVSNNGLASGDRSVWKSVDGATWEEEASNTAFGTLLGHSLVSFENRLWIHGGIKGLGNGEAAHNTDVWVSNDGVSWSIARQNPAFAPRANHVGVHFKTFLLLFAGRGSEGGLRNDIYFSGDGVEWPIARDNANFPPMERTQTVFFDDRLWILGGRRSETADDTMMLWSSEDGFNWVEEVGAVIPSQRHDHSAVVFQGKIFVMGGKRIFDFDQESSATDLWILD